MKRALLGILLVAAGGLSSSPAFALSDPRYPTWYIGLRGSANTLEATDLGTYPLPETNYDPGFGVGAHVGVTMPAAFIQPLAGLSFEAEISRYWQHIDNDRVDIFFPVMLQSDGEREFTVTAYMANAYYRFPFGMFGGLLRPYVGGRIGWAEVTLERDPVAPFSGGDADDAVAAMQGMAGFSFLASPDADTEWNVGYRYFESDDPIFDDGFGGKTIVDNRIHSLELGFRYRF